MKLRLLFFPVLLLYTALHAQLEPPPADSPPIESPIDEPTNGRVTFDYGFTYVRPWELNKQLFGASGGFTQLWTIGFTEGFAADAYDNSILSYDGAWAFHKFRSSENVVSLNNLETHYTLKGWELMTSSYGIDFVPLDAIDFAGGIGAYWGNLKLVRWSEADNSGTTKYTNPFVAPMVRAELRFNFWYFTLGARWSYRYDITDSKWKRKNDGMESLPGYKFRETQFIFFVGFRDNGEE